MLEIVEAVEADVHQIAVVRHISWENTYRGIISDDLIDDFDYGFHEKLNTDLILNEQKHLCKLVLEGLLIGYVSYGVPTYTCFDKDGIHVYSLYILKEYQGLGFGKQVVGHIEKLCKDEHKQFIYLTCNLHNHSARAFYQAVGFELMEERLGNGAKQED